MQNNDQVIKFGLQVLYLSFTFVMVSRNMERYDRMVIDKILVLKTNKAGNAC